MSVKSAKHLMPHGTTRHEFINAAALGGLCPAVPPRIGCECVLQSFVDRPEVTGGQGSMAGGVIRGPGNRYHGAR